MTSFYLCIVGKVVYDSAFKRHVNHYSETRAEFSSHLTLKKESGSKEKQKQKKTIGTISNFL